MVSSLLQLLCWDDQKRDDRPASNIVTFVYRGAHTVLLFDYFEKARMMSDENGEENSTVPQFDVFNNKIPCRVAAANLAARGYYLFANSKRIMRSKRLGLNNESILESDVYGILKALTRESFYKNDMERPEKRETACIFQNKSLICI